MTKVSLFRNSALVLALAATGLALGTAVAQSREDGPRAGFFAKVDANQDGAITRAEFDALRAEHGREMDANRDGIVTFAEHKAAREAMAEARFVKRHDQDGDGRVSVAELSARGDKHFDRMDANDDGTITADEMQHRKGMRRGRGGHGGDHANH